MEEEKVKIPSKGLNLEGLLFFQKGAGRGVVITHPHTLYGGDMNNNVVQTIARVYQARGFSTLTRLSA